MSRRRDSATALKTSEAAAARGTGTIIFPLGNMSNYGGISLKFHLCQVHMTPTLLPADVGSTRGLPFVPREIALSRAGGHSRAGESHFERMHLAVERRRGKAERILMMQLVGDASKRRG